MPEPYAVRMNSNGTKTKYWSRREYERGRIQASGVAAAQRAGINRAVGGRVV
ncbi:MAG: hypothetical protein ACI3YI_02865 [Bacteroidaceae bacterium]